MTTHTQPAASHMIRNFSIGLIAAATLITPTVWSVAYATQNASGVTSATSSQSAGPQQSQQQGPSSGNTSQADPQGESPRGASNNDSNSQGGMGGMGGLVGGGGASTSTELIALLQEDAPKYRWAAATTGSQSAASYQLASEVPVMAIGGFNGTDNYPTLEQFKEYVSKKLVHYYIAGNSMGGQANGGSSAAEQIAQWVQENFTAQTIDGVTVYDLTHTEE
ncbi:hypothetical protein QP141_03685 [Alloscardovia omnicolens]|uniref:hypothetical protein n=1 Tax=Alloscardovia omnicolens TaxID=419015 RepID=UPI000C793D72|nr:hypothetical protein [Alloscardovia omnicolens]MDK6249542.1 hypothetical protein [Alloscardovia omnicolens]MDK6445406.1 hypothetical protein [Alloscardovia omnicolens]PKY78144.1 hypothetical protein CYJ33_07475 [Alloscardovia omnicolens]